MPFSKRRKADDTRAFVNKFFSRALVNTSSATVITFRKIFYGRKITVVDSYAYIASLLRPLAIACKVFSSRNKASLPAKISCLRSVRLASFSGQ